MKIESGLRDYNTIKYNFYESKWIVGHNKKVFKLSVGDIIETTVWGGFNIFHKSFTKFRVTSLQSNGYACVEVLDVALSINTAIPYDEIISVKSEVK